MSTQYEHTQKSFLMPGALGLGALSCLFELFSSDTGGRSFTRWGLGLGSGALLAGSALFSSLTIAVEDGMVRWYFGPGFWKKHVPLDEIQDYEVVENPWYYGWGIRYTPHGWLYNVEGRKAVELRLKGGTKIRLGTDEPHALQRAIQQAKNRHV